MLRKRLGARPAETVALSFFNIAIRQLESSFRPPSFNNFLHKFQSPTQKCGSVPRHNRAPYSYPPPLLQRNCPPDLRHSRSSA